MKHIIQFANGDYLAMTALDRTTVKEEARIFDTYDSAARFAFRSLTEERMKVVSVEDSDG